MSADKFRHNLSSPDFGVSDGTEVCMKGEVCDRIYDKGGHLIEEVRGHNLVVNSFLKLVMSLLKNQNNYKGIQYWAIGSGSSSWDTNTPNPDPNAVKLTNEIGRVIIDPSEIVFLNSGLNPSTTPTNIIQITHTFGLNDCNGDWREFGIFGGNATSAANSGVLINKRHHGIIRKTDEMIVERTMRFTLTLS